MNSGAYPKVCYVLKRFPRISETFILNEILELERRGVEVVIFSVLKPDEGRFHPQIARLKAKVYYLERLDARRWHTWIGKEWPLLAADTSVIWSMMEKSLALGEGRHLEEFWWGLWVAARARKYGVQHFHSHFGTMSSTIAHYASKISGIPYSVTVHAKDIFAYDMTEHLLRLKLHEARPVVTVTHYNKRYLLGKAPEVPSENIRVLHNGIDQDHFTPADFDQREDNLILSVGRLIPKKGFGDLLESLRQLKDRGIAFKCMIVGDGPEGTALQQKQHMLGLDEEVEFTGPLKQDQLVPLMHRASLFVLPCTVGPDGNIDALPTVLLEAQACGLPIASTDISGIPEIVESEVDGLLVPPDDPAKMSQVIERMLHSKELRRKFSEKALIKCREKFNLKTNVGKLLDMFINSGKSVTTPKSKGNRVLYVCADRGLPFGGTKGGSVHVREFLDNLVRVGFEPTAMVARRDRSSLYDPDYHVHALPRSLFANESSARLGGSADNTISDSEVICNQAMGEHMEDLNKALPYDFVYERYSLFATAGRQIAEAHGIPFILEVNSPLVEEAATYRGLSSSEFAYSVEKDLFQAADHILAVSETMRDYIVRVAPEAHVTVLPNGVELEKFKGVERDSWWRTKLGAQSDDDFVLVFVGKVRPWHGLDRLLRALKTVLASEDKVRLAVVGDVDDGVKKDLDELLKDEQLAGHVTFVGSVAVEAVPRVLAAADMAIAPYPSIEPFYFSPLKLYEYMAAGKAIIASDIGQVRQVMQHEKDALLVSPDDENALAQAILRLCKDRELAESLGTQAARAAEQHGWHHRLEVVAKILRGFGVGAQSSKDGHARSLPTP